jgi:serine/threonine-protein kinase HipA
MSTARVDLWGTCIGAVSWDQEQELAFFEYDPEFLPSGIEVAPLFMPLGRRVFSFPALSRAAFRGLPGLLADALPDRFGNAVIDTWLASQGRSPETFNPVERLCYTGSRGMGALEFVPAIGPDPSSSETIDVASLVSLASAILSDRRNLIATLAASRGVQQILRVGTSAGGARAKAVIAWNPQTGEVRSGQADADAGFSHWLLKFDGVSGNRDRELSLPQGYGRIEYAYSQMARAAGIEMEECRLLEEGGRAHFLTRRFDRGDVGEKLHLQSLGAIAHLDYNMAGAWSYEQALQVMRSLSLPMAQIEEQFRRIAFNILARNQDDHVKNIAFLMNKRGVWSLSPAYDLTWSFNPEGEWTSRHQMSLNGKRDDFTLLDFRAAAATASMKRGRAESILEEVRVAVLRWPDFAAEAEVPEDRMEFVGSTLRIDL